MNAGDKTGETIEMIGSGEPTNLTDPANSTGAVVLDTQKGAGVGGQTLEFLDEDGYPTDHALEFLRLYPADSLIREPRKLMDFVRGLWQYSDWGWRETLGVNPFGRRVVEYSVSTGGWSGNELLVGALRDNRVFWSLFWQESRRGGHFKFEMELPSQDGDGSSR